MRIHAGRHYGPGGSGALDALGSALSDQATAMQLFAGGNRTRQVTAPSDADVEAFRDRSAGLYKTIHASYVINACHPPESDLAQATVTHLVDALRWGERLGFDSVVFHPGSALQYPRADALSWCRQNVSRALDVYRGPVRLLLENSAGDKHDRKVGRDLGELQTLVDEVRDVCGDRTGICVDTAHAFPAGYTVEQIAGVHRDYPAVEMIHLNSCKPHITRGCRVDRHAAFSDGNFSAEQLQLMVRGLRHLPLILESSSAEDLRQVFDWAQEDERR